MSIYPEHDKLAAVKDKSQTIGDFLVWLHDEQGIELAQRHEHTNNGCCDEQGNFRCGATNGELLPTGQSIQSLLAAFFQIDEGRLEREKQAMLDALHGYAKCFDQ